MIKWILGGVSVFAAGATATAVAVPVVIYGKAKEKLKNFIALEGAAPVLTNKEKINYVALGDSISAGYDGFLGKDYVAFGDFIAEDLKKHNRLGEYKNFSSSGEKIWTLYNNTILHPSTSHGLKDADLITVSIGSNDLLTMAKALQITFTTVEGGRIDPSKNVFRTIIDQYVNQGVTADETLKLIDKSLDQFVTAFENNDYSGFLSIQPAMFDTIFDLIKRNLMIFVRDLHKVAPKALVYLLAPYLPFENLPQSLLNGKISDNGNLNVKEVFAKFRNSIKEASETAGFIKYIEMGELEDWKNEIQNKTYHPFDDGDATTTLPEEAYATSRVLPNVMDIHPSTYGHEILGNALFKEFAKNDLGISVDSNKLTHGHISNGNNIPESVERIQIDGEWQNIFSPEYYDETHEEGVSRETALLLTKIFKSSEEPKANLANTLLGLIDHVVEMIFSKSSDGTIYESVVDNSGFFPTAKLGVKNSGVASEGMLAPYDIENLLTTVQNNEDFNKIVLKLFAVFAKADIKHVNDALATISKTFGLIDPDNPIEGYQSVDDSARISRVFDAKVQAIFRVDPTASFSGDATTIQSSDGSAKVDVREFGAKNLADLYSRTSLIETLHSMLQLYTSFNVFSFNNATVANVDSMKWIKKLFTDILTDDYADIDSIIKLTDLDANKIHEELTQLKAANPNAATADKIWELVKAGYNNNTLPKTKELFQIFENGIVKFWRIFGPDKSGTNIFTQP